SAGAASAEAKQLRTWSSQLLPPDAQSLVRDEAFALVELRRTGRVRRVDLQAHAVCATRLVRLEPLAQQRLAEPAAALALTHDDVLHPAAVLGLLPLQRAADELAVALDEQPQVAIELLVPRHECEPAVVRARNVVRVPPGVRLVE